MPGRKGFGADRLGLGEEAACFEERAEKTARTINEKLWDEEHSIYLDFDLAVGRPIYSYVAPNLAGPLFAGIPDEGSARRMVGVLEGSGFGLCRNKLLRVATQTRLSDLELGSWLGERKCSHALEVEQILEESVSRYCAFPSGVGGLGGHPAHRSPLLAVTRTVPR